MTIYTPDDFKPILWKNGKGTTTELIRLPENSDLTNFDLRISIADVTDDGEFSQFPNYARFISVLEGEYFHLSHNGSDFIRVNRFDIHSFSGSDQTFCRVDGQILKDFNVMVSDRLKNRVTVHFTPKGFSPKPNGCYFIFVIDGEMLLESGEAVLKNHLIQMDGTEFSSVKLNTLACFVVEIKDWNLKGKGTSAIKII